MLDIETGIKNFRITVLRSGLVSGLSGLKSWYEDFQDCSLDIKTGINTFMLAVFISRLVSRFSGLQSNHRMSALAIK